VIDEAPPIDLELPVPAAPRTPVDVVAIPSTPPSSHSTHTVTPPYGQVAFGNRISPVRASAPIHEPRTSRMGTPVTPRPVISGFPVSRDSEGKALPRAYVVRRRSSPRGVSVVLPDETAADTPEASPAPKQAAETPPAIDVAPFRAALAAATPVPPAAAPLPPAVSDVADTKPAPAPEPKRYEPPSPWTASRSVEIDPNPTAAPSPAPSPPPAPRPSASTPRRDTTEVRRNSSGQPVPMSRGQFIAILLAVAAIAVSASAVVSYIVSHPPASTTTAPTP
jgi:hypothetical protein